MQIDKKLHILDMPPAPLLLLLQELQCYVQSTIFRKRLLLSLLRIDRQMHLRHALFSPTVKTISKNVFIRSWQRGHQFKLANLFLAEFTRNSTEKSTGRTKCRQQQVGKKKLFVWILQRIQGLQYYVHGLSLRQM